MRVRLPSSTLSGGVTNKANTFLVPEVEDNSIRTDRVVNGATVIAEGEEPAIIGPVDHLRRTVNVCRSPIRIAILRRINRHRRAVLQPRAVKKS